MGCALLLAAAAALVLVEFSIYRAIRRQAEADEARPADAIVVFGAAQYNGVPSPVFKARLDHAFELEERGFAPVIVTTGGSGADLNFTEAGVGRDYLIQKGVAADKILSETHGSATSKSVTAVAQIFHQRQKKTCIAVSDGFHLYRIKHLFAAEGIAAYGSPAPDSPIESDAFQRVVHSLREMCIATLWYVGLKG